MRKFPKKETKNFAKNTKFKKCKIPHEIYSDLMYRFKNNYRRQFI